MTEAIHEFLLRHAIAPELLDVEREAKLMEAEMRRGLSGGGSMPMIPTYLRTDGEIVKGRAVAVIDAGGTNFRCALLRFTEDGCSVEKLQKVRMPGTERPVSWEEFISFTADMIQPLMDEAELIGFCFSYAAVITPEIDGKVICIDKEVTVTGSAGKMVGASLEEELCRRGIVGRRVVILNDTVAVLLGGMAAMGKANYGGFIGQVSGTGTNTCCTLPLSMIEKLGLAECGEMIVNTESGQYDGIAGGDIDRALDEESGNPGQKHFEKMTSGVYLGQLCSLALGAACAEGLLSPGAGAKLAELGRIDSSWLDAWSCGEKLDAVCVSGEDEELVRCVSMALFLRSARCMCVNLLALLRLTGAGEETKALICAEGSLVQKGRLYRLELESLLAEYAGVRLGRKYEFIVGQDTTLPGSAAAALLNI